jgi:predicted nucleotidyltransferase
MIDSMVASDSVLEQVTTTLVAKLHPIRIILFGSRARGDSNDSSDYDFLIELDTTLKRPYREIEVHRLFRERNWAMDVFVYTPAEVRANRDDVGTVVHMAEKEGRVLYERP